MPAIPGPRSAGRGRVAGAGDHVGDALRKPLDLDLVRPFTITRSSGSVPEGRNNTAPCRRVRARHPAWRR